MTPLRSMLPAVVGLVTAFLEFSAATPLAAQSSEVSRLVDETGRPVGGASVYIQSRPYFPIPDEVKDTGLIETKADGTFKAPENIPPESLVVISKPGFVTRGFPGETILPAEIELRAGDKLLGGVANDKGVTITGALIGPPMPHGQITAESVRTQPMLFARTDAQGMFVLEGVPAGRHEVLVRGEGVSPKLVMMQTGVSKRLVLESGGTTVTGVVRGSRDQSPQPSMYVEASAPGIKLYARTDDAGRYAFPHLEDREWQFRAVTPKAEVRHPVQTVGIKAQPEPYEVNLLYSQGVKVAGVVMDAETSAPMTDMTIMLDAEPRRETKTDAVGHFSFDDVEQFSDPVLRWDALMYNYADPLSDEEKSYFELRFPESGDMTTLTIPLRRRAFINGKVTDKWQRPVPGATVTAKALGDATVRRGKAVQTAEYTALSRPNGTFILLIAPPGAYEISAVTDQYVSEVKTIESWTTSPAEVTLELGAMATVSGTVVNSEDKPVALAKVEVRVPVEEAASSPELAGTGPLIKSGTATNSGLFELKGFSPRKVDVVASHPDYGQRAVASVDLTGSTSPSVTLKFPGGSDFSALVTRSDGGIVPGAAVRIYFTYGGQQRMTERDTDGTGRASFRGLPSKNLDRIQINEPRFAEFVKTQIALPQKDFAITLKERGNIAVTVDELAQPVDSKNVLKALLMRADAREGEAPEAGKYAVVNERETAEGKARFESLEPGWYKVAAKRGALYAESDAVELAEGADTPVSIVLEAGGQVRGRVVDKATRQPVAQALVTLSPESSVFEVEPIKSVTSSDGSFVMAGVPAGAMELTVVHPPYPDHLEKVAVPSRGEIDVPVLLSSEMAKLTGTVRYGAEGLPHALLVLHKSAGGENPVASAVSDGAGRYVFEQVPPGKYVLTAEGAGSDAEELRQKQSEVTVTLPESSADMVFQPLTQVTGTVRVEGLTKAPAGRTVLFMPQDGGTAATATIKEEGRYEAALEPGAYTAGLDDSPGQEVKIPPSATPHTLDLKF